MVMREGGYKREDRYGDEGERGETRGRIGMVMREGGDKREDRYGDEGGRGQEEG